MKALQKNAPFGENTYGLQKSYKVHKHRVKNMKKCVDNETPRSFVGQSGPRSPNRRVVAKQMAEENLRKENFLLARRIFTIMQGESSITQSINDNDHLENHPGTMNFRRRLEEAQRIYHKNLMFAIRMRSIQPYYRQTDLTVVRPTRQRADSPDGSKKHKTKFMKEFEYSLRLAEEQSGSVDDNGLGVYQGFIMKDSNQSSSPEADAHGYHNNRPRTILLQYTKAQDNRILDVVVLKEPFRDRYAIFGLDVDDGQRYELRLSSEDVSNILDGDILVTSVDNVEVWMALLNKVRLKPVSAFNQMPFTNQEIDVLSSNGLAFDFPAPFQASSAVMVSISTKSMTSTPNNDIMEFSGGVVGDRLPSATGASGRPQSRAPSSRTITAGAYAIPNPDEFDAVPFDYGHENDDVPLSSRTEASEAQAVPSKPRTASGGGSRPNTSSRHARGSREGSRSHNSNRSNNNNINNQNDIIVDVLENDADTAEMIRASNVAAALAIEHQQHQTTATNVPVAVKPVEAPALVPKQPTSRPSSKPASGRVTGARTTTTAAANNTATTAAPAAASVLKPTPPNKPKTPNDTATSGSGHASRPGQGSRASRGSNPISSQGPPTGRPQSMNHKPAAPTPAISSPTSAHSALSKVRLEEKAVIAQEVAAKMTEEKLVISTKRLPEGLEELIVSPSQREATEEFVGIVSEVASEAVIQAVHSIKDNLLIAGSGAIPVAGIEVPSTNTSNNDNMEESLSVAVPELAPIVSATPLTVVPEPSVTSSLLSPPGVRESTEYDESFETLDQSTFASSTISVPHHQHLTEKKSQRTQEDIPEEDIPDETS